MVNVQGLKGIHRKFGGKVYEIEERAHTKRNAEQYAKSLRKTHYVRIVKLMPAYIGQKVSYGVYVRKK